MSVYSSGIANNIYYLTSGDKLSGYPSIRINGKNIVIDEFTGNGYISDFTKIQTGSSSFIPSPYAKVWLFNQDNGLLVRETKSDANGAYNVYNINPNKTYFAVAFDANNIYDVAATRNLKITVS